MADNNHSTLRSLFSDIANSIRRKTEWTNNIIADTFPEAIDKINWDATISSGSQLMNGVIAYGNNGKYVGSIQSKTENDLVVNGPNVTVPAGYYGNNATASVAVTTHPDPTVGYNLSNINNGIVAINASHTQNTGYVIGNTTSAVTNVNIGIATINNPSGSKILNKPSIELNKSTGVVTTSSESVNVTAYANTTNNGYTTNKTRSGNVVITGNTNTLNIGLSNPTASIVTINGSTVSGYVSGNDGYTNSFNIPIIGTVPVGVLVSSVTSHTNTNPSVTISHSGNISTIGTTTKPSGTAGTDYYQIGFSNSVINGNTNARAYGNVSTNGYVTTTNNTASSWSNKIIGASVTQPATYYVNKGTLAQSNISGAAFLENTGDYGFRATVVVPEGYHTGETVTKDFTTGIFPAPESKANSNQMLTGYSLYDEDGRLITGSMPNQGAQNSTITTQGGTYTIPEGYHDGNGVVTASLPSASINTIAGSKAQSKPAFSIDDSTGVVTATVAATSGTAYGNVTSSGYVSSGTRSGTFSMTASSNTYTVPNGYIRTIGAISVYNNDGIKFAEGPINARDFSLKADSEIVRSINGYINSNYIVNDFDSYHFYINNQTISTTTITPSTSAQTITVSEGYRDSDATITVSAMGAGTLAAGTAAVLNNSNGNVRYYRNVSAAGYLAINNTPYYLQLNTKAGSTTTVTSTAETTLVNAGQFVTGAIKVKGGAGTLKANAAEGGSGGGEIDYNNIWYSDRWYELPLKINVSGFNYNPIATNGILTTASTIQGTHDNIDVVAGTWAAEINTTIEGTTSRTPIIAVQAVPSGVTNAANAAATTTAPSSGVYVAVKSPANTTTAVANISGLNAGYTDGTEANTIINEGTKTAGAAASATTYVQIKSGAINNPSGSAAQSTPTFSFDATNRVLTASVAAKNGTAYRNVTTAGWLGTSTTGGNFQMTASSNTYTLDAATINTPSGSAKQSKPGLSFNASNGVITATVAATSGTAYANVTGEGYVATGTKSGTFTMTAADSNTINVGLATRTAGTQAFITAGLVTNISNGAVTATDNVKLTTGANGRYRINVNAKATTTAGYIAAGTSYHTSGATYINKTTSSVTNQTVTGTISASGANASTTITGMETTTTNTGFIVSASANATSGAITGGSKTAYANVSEGYTPSAVSASAVATVSSVSAKTASNSNTQYIKAATISDFSAKYKAQSKPTFSININNGVVTTSVAATTQDVYRNVSTGYVGTANTTKMTFTMNASSNTYTIPNGYVQSIGNITIQNNGYMNIMDTPSTENAHHLILKTWGETVSVTNGYINPSYVANTYDDYHYYIDHASATVTASGTVSRAPVLRFGGVPAGTVNAAGGAITTTAPTSGPYITVNTPANTTTSTATSAVTVEGYLNEATQITFTGKASGAAAMANRYIPIKVGSVTTTQGTASDATVTGYVDIGQGWVEAQNITVSGSVSTGTLAAGTAAVLNNSNGNIRYYRNVSAAGYIAANTTAYYLQLNTKAGGTTTVTTTETTLINAGQFAVGAIKAKAAAGTLAAGTAAVLNNSNGNIRYYRNVSTAGYIAANTTAYYLQLNTKGGSTTYVNGTGATLVNAGQFVTGAIIAKAANCTYDSTNTRLIIPTGLVTT